MLVVGKVCLDGILKIMIYIPLIFYIMENQSKFFIILDFGILYLRINFKNLEIIVRKFFLMDFQNVLSF